MEKKELKFRVWNGSEMEHDIMVGKFGIFYVNPSNNGIDENDTASLSSFNTKYPDDIPVMQFSGLTDKNGVEIFEGDILEFEDEQKSVVKWLQGGLTCEADFGDYDLTTVGWAIDLLGCCEVVGNIYQNPNQFGKLEAGGKN